MCDSIINSRKQEREQLKSLNFNQLFSFEILIENVTVTHGPYKNSGDLDHITESESEDSDDEKTSDAEDYIYDEMGNIIGRKGEGGFGVDGEGGRFADGRFGPGGGRLGEDNKDLDKLNKDSEKDKKTKGGSDKGTKGKDVTVGMALLDHDRSKSPRYKKTCHTIAIDSWAPGVISGEPYVPEYTHPNDIAQTPPTLCKSCLNECLLNKKKPSDKCTCEKEYCFRYPIDSLGPKIRSTSGISHKKCVCPELRKQNKNQERKKKQEESESDEGYDDDESEGREDLKAKGDWATGKSEHKSNKDKVGSAGDGQRKGKQSAGKDKGGSSKSSAAKGKGGSSKGSAGKGKESSKGSSGKGKGKPKKEVKPVEEEEAPPEEPKPKPKKKKKRCTRPPPPEGPLPPLRVSVSIFHIKDIKINQVDLEKLYPPEDDEPIPEDESQTELLMDNAPRVSREIQPPVSVKKPKGKEENKDKGKQGKQASSKSSGKSSTKSSGSAKPGKAKDKPKSTSKTSQGSKNVVKSHKGVDEHELSQKLNTLRLSMPSQTTQGEQDHDHALSGLSKYRELGGWDATKCSGDVALKQKQTWKMRRSDREKRREVIESLRALTDFRRGVSFVFTSTPLDIIKQLLMDYLEIVVDRCAINGPAYPIGKVRIKFASVYRDRVQVSARENIKKALWTCQESTYPIIDCKGHEVGNLTLYICLTSLGRALVSTSLVSENSLHEYTSSAYYISETGNNEPKPRATGFKMCYGNLQQVNLKDYNAPKPPRLHF